MPFLARVKTGGTFDGYFEALQNLDSAFVRFAPWFPYPQVAVPELYETDCTPGGRGSSWNSTLLDGVLADFMLAVCGPLAAQGQCHNNKSVVPLLSTMPSWLYVGALNYTATKDPWAYPRGFGMYEQTGKPLKDPSCRAMARYAARYVGWYTAGGMTDECGVWHESGLRYNWPILSVMNEDETQTPPEKGVEYTICFDAWVQEIKKVNPDMVLMGPETTDGATWPGGSVLNFTLYFLNGSNHYDGKPPPLISNHHGDGAFAGPPYSNLFDQTDVFIKNIAAPLDDARRLHAPDTELVMNEYVPQVTDWCDDSYKIDKVQGKGGKCPSWLSQNSTGIKINRKTLGWNAAAASFAYGFGLFAALGYKFIGADQLVGGPYPDNEPCVTMLDWTTGEPNAKYWVLQMLAGLGIGPKQLFTSASSSNQLYALGLKVEGQRKILLVSKSGTPQMVHLEGYSMNTTAMVLDGSPDGVTVGLEPGFQPPVPRVLRGGSLALGPYGVALASL